VVPVELVQGVPVRGCSPSAWASWAREGPGRGRDEKRRNVMTLPPVVVGVAAVGLLGLRTVFRRRPRSGLIDLGLGEAPGPAGAAGVPCPQDPSHRSQEACR
jgi:hypothetical protein